MISTEEALTSLSRAETEGTISGAAVANIRRWLTEPPFVRYRPLLLDEIEGQRWRALDDAFFAVLEFGTGGRRGKMYPVGTNVLNERTIAESARGLADYVLSRRAAADGRPRCVIARDTRHRSPEFAELCARVLAAAGFEVFLFDAPRSTPLLSFAVRYLGCDAGIMITASHNPPSDNGFKCYGRSGGQVIPPDDKGIIDCVAAVSDREIPDKPLEQALADGSIVWAGEEIDQAYIASVLSESVSHARDLSIVYTPLHGVGESSVGAILKAAGFSSVHVLESQRAPDGDFPNVPGHVSNPENPATLAAAIIDARDRGADLVLASDPDADRIGVGLPTTADPKGPWTTLDGNQIGVLLAAFVMKQTADQGKLRDDHYLVTTLVSTQMASALARREGIRTEDDLLVGFKWIARRIDETGPAGFLFGFEESHGYLKGHDVRDKDAGVASLLFAELAATVKDRKQSVLEYLDDLFIDVGHYGERLVTKTYEGREGVLKIARLMDALRSRPPRTIGGLAVSEVRDYETGEVRRLAQDGPPTVSPLAGPNSNLLFFQTEREGTRFAARPSGTEPKIKFYLFARTAVAGPDALAAAKLETAGLLGAMARDLDAYIAEAVG